MIIGISLMLFSGFYDVVKKHLLFLLTFLDKGVDPSGLDFMKCPHKLGVFYAFSKIFSETNKTNTCFQFDIFYIYNLY